MSKWSDLVVKHNNGVWKLFDTYKFNDVYTFDSAASLIEAVRVNGGPVGRMTTETEALV